MNSITLNPSRSALETVDIEKAMQNGRRLRSKAVTSFLKTLFTHSKDKPAERDQRAERSRRKGGFSPDCTAAA